MEETTQTATQMLIATLTENVDVNKITHIIITAMVAFFINKKITAPIAKKIMTKAKDKFMEKIDSIIDKSTQRIQSMNGNNNDTIEEMANQLDVIKQMMRQMESSSVEYSVISKCDNKLSDVDRKFRDIENSLERRMNDYEKRLDIVMRSILQYNQASKDDNIVTQPTTIQMEVYTGPKKTYDPRDKL